MGEEGEVREGGGKRSRCVEGTTEEIKKRERELHVAAGLNWTLLSPRPRDFSTGNTRPMDNGSKAC